MKNYDLLNGNDLFVMDSSVSGPNVLILGGVHGNEYCGVRAIDEVINKNLISLNKGKVTFVYANREAINKEVRFVEENLNRCFLEDKLKTNSYEERMAQDIMKIMDSCDVCLDLHASSCKNSIPFIICENNALEYIKDFPIEIVCGGFDEHEPGGTDYYMNLLGKVGICVECGYKEDLRTKDVAITCITNILSSLGMIDYNVKRHPKEFLEVNELYQPKEEFKLIKEFDDFEKMSEGSVIGYDGDNEVRTKSNGFILFARDVKKLDPDRDAFLYGICKKH
ncbi:succinylglutamate desuccinylase/aspartoacylase family protein [Candidatus Woesearchaeota archaeon]|nr:succinylglutamate desuccinylase/aspartoacylase family protein [Candidatus Woesearchaeota archaeon]